MTISKDSDDYAITITGLTLEGGPQVEGEGVDNKFHTNLSTKVLFLSCQKSIGV